MDCDVLAPANPTTLMRMPEIYAAYALGDNMVAVVSQEAAEHHVMVNYPPEVETEGIPIPSVMPCVIQIGDSVMPTANQEVLRDLKMRH